MGDIGVHPKDRSVVVEGFPQTCSGRLAWQ